MTARSTLVTAALVAALAAGLWIATAGRPSPRELETRREMLLPFDPADIQRIELAGGGSRTVLQRERGVWLVAEPLKDLADPAAVRKLLETAAGLGSYETIELGKEGRGPQAKEFGLASGKLSLALSGPGGKWEIWFGKETAIEGRQYARVAGTRLIDVVSSELADLAAGGADAFRNKFLFQMDAGDVTALRWRSERGGFELALQNGRWQILKPERARADSGRVQNLLRNLTRARLEEFLPAAGETAAPAALEGAVVEMESATGARSAIEGISENGGRLTGRLAGRNADVVLPAMIADLFRLAPRDLREQSLMRFNPDAVDVIRIEREGRVLSLSRDGERWKGDPGGFEADPEKAEVLMRMLAAAGLAEFAGDTRASVPEAGLDTPSATVRLLSRLSEDSAYDKAGEHPIGAVLFGASAPGGRVYAASEAEPFVFTVPAELAQYATTETAAWLSLAVLFGEPEDVTWIEAQSGAWRIARGKNDEWAIERGRGVLNPAAADSLARALARLRAVQWLDAAPPETTGPPDLALRFGWDHPDLEAEQALLLEVWTGPERHVGRLSGTKRCFTLSSPLTELLFMTPLSH